MPPTTTTNLALILPEVGFDDSIWGGDLGLNHDLSLIDAVFSAAGSGTSVGIHVGVGKKALIEGTLTVLDEGLILYDAADATNKARVLVKATLAGPANLQRDYVLPAAPDELVGLSGDQTLTDKTLIEPIIELIKNGGLLTLPIGPETLVARNTVDTLVNKTLTAPALNAPQMADAHADVMTADAFRVTGSNIIGVAGNITLAAVNNGQTIIMNGAGLVKVFVPAGLPAGFSCTVIQGGSGSVWFEAAGAAVNSRIGLHLAGPWAIAGLIGIIADVYAVGGDVGA